MMSGDTGITANHAYHRFINRLIVQLINRYIFYFQDNVNVGHMLQDVDVMKSGTATLLELWTISYLRENLLKEAKIQ